MMRRLTMFSTLAMLIGFGTAATAGAQQVNWQVHTINPAERWTSVSQFEFAKLMEEKTDGLFKMTVYPAGSLGFKGPDILDATSDNLVQLAQVWGSHVAGQERIMEMFALPSFVPWDYELMQKLWTGLHDDFDRLLSTRYKVRLVGMLQNEPRNLHTKQKVESLDDLAGLKIRTVGPIESTYTKRLGAVPVPVNWGELYTALATGVVDGNWAGDVAEVGMKFYEIVRYTYDTKGGGIGVFVVVSQTALDELPPDLRKAFWDNSPALMTSLRTALLKSKERGRNRLLEEGNMTVIPVAGADRKRMLEAASPILTEWAAKLDPESREIFEKAKSIVDAHYGR